MSKLDRYIGGGVLMATLGVLLLLVGLDALTSVIDETDDIGDGYGFLDILVYVGYTLPRRIHEFVPFAALIGALIALGRLAASSELVVMRAAGVSISRMAIGFLRIGSAFVVCHLVGRAYRYDVAGWFTKYLGMTKESISAFERGFDKAEWALIPFFAGSNIVAALSGVRQTPPIKLVPLLTIGIGGRLALMWWLARTFEDQLVDFLGLLQRYQWWAVGISVGLVVLVNSRNLRR